MGLVLNFKVLNRYKKFKEGKGGEGEGRFTFNKNLKSEKLVFFFFNVLIRMNAF